jgi:hypothetical protein
VVENFRACAQIKGLGFAISPDHEKVKRMAGLVRQFFPSPSEKF